MAHSVTLGRRGRTTSLLAMLAVALGLTPTGSSAAEPAYLLGPMDVLRLRVSEWRTANETFRDWSSVSGDYVVGPSGSISIPFVGEIRAEGRVTGELATLVSNTLQQRFGLSDRPDAVLEVSKFRPIYVAGDVQTPGALEFAPGMSVIKAVAMAGGQRRSGSPDMRIERDVITAQGDLAVATLEQHRLIMRRTRLQAELDGAENFTIPNALAGAPEASALFEDERVIMVADREKIALQLQSLTELKVLLGSEIESLANRRRSVQRQIDSSQKELTNVGSLANRGLSVNSRVSELERRIADYEERLLEIDATTLRARQDVSKADQDAIRLENERRSELAVQRQEADAQLEAVAAKRKSQAGLLEEAQALGPISRRPSDRNTYTYFIVRAVDGQSIEMSVDQNSEVHPGDVVKVEYRPSAAAY